MVKTKVKSKVKPVKVKEDCSNGGNRTTISIAKEIHDRIKINAAHGRLSLSEYLDKAIPNLYEEPECKRIDRQMKKEIAEGRFNEIMEVKK